MRNTMPADEVSFCLSDISNIFITLKKQIFGFAVIFASICFFYVMIKPDVYQASAKFSEMPEKKESLIFKDFFPSDSIENDKNKAKEMIQSRLVIEPVVKKFGMQASCYLRNKSRFFAIYKRYFRNLKREFKIADKESYNFGFKDVNCPSTASRSYLIFFKSNDSFEIFDMKKKMRTKGKVNEKIFLDEISFILQQVPKNLKRNKAYILSFASVEACIAKVKRDLKIKVSRYSGNVLDLTYKDVDPYRAQNTLNGLMRSYVKYLEKESETFARDQFKYLEQRKRQVGQDLESALDNHAKYLSDNLIKNGFIALEQEISSFTNPHNECLKRLFELDLELAHIDLLKKSDSDFIFNDELVGKKLSAMSSQKSALNQKKDALSMSLFSQEKKAEDPLLGTYSQNMDKLLKDISNLRKEKTEIEKAIDQLNKKEIFKTSSHNENLKTEKKLDDNKIKEDLNYHLSQFKRALITQEKILKSRPIFAQSQDKMFEGLDADTVNELYAKYNHKIDQTQAKTKQLEIILKEIDNGQFETSSISPFLSDSVSIGLVKQANDIQFRLNDDDILSEKDKMRLEKDLSLIRKFLKTHITQTLQAERSLEDLYKNKFYALQMAALDRTNQQISILDQQAKDYLFFRKENILKEKNLLQDQIQSIRNNMFLLPEKWKKEKLLDMRSGAALKMIQSLTNLIESKTIEHHLKQIASKPIELAELPKGPNSKKGFFIFVVTFLTGLILAFLYFFIRALSKGFMATLDNLNAIKEVTLGEISYACDGPNVEYIQDNDLEVLRNIIQFSEPLLEKSGKVLSLIGSNGPNYAHCLSDLVGKIGKKVLLLELNFQSIHSNKGIGMAQYLDKNLKEIPIQSFHNYDFLPSGVTSRYGTEILRSLSFHQFIKELKEKYDIVIAYGKASPTSAEATAYLQFSDKLVVSFIDETVQKLSAFFQKESMVGFLKVK